MAFTSAKSTPARSYHVKVCPVCPESELRPILSTTQLYNRSDRCLECNTNLLILQEVEPSARSAGCKRLKLCKICAFIPSRTSCLVNWQGTGKSKWGCFTRCGIGKHGAFTIFHEMGSSTLAMSPKAQPMRTSSDPKSTILTDTERQSAKRKRGSLDDIGSENGHNSGPPQAKKTKVIHSILPQSAEQEASDRGDFESFEEEYAYYAAKVRRLLGQDPAKPRTYPQTTNKSISADTTARAKHITGQLPKLSATTSRATIKPFALPLSLPSRPPISRQTLALQFGDFHSTTKATTAPLFDTRAADLHIEPIRVRLPSDKGLSCPTKENPKGDCGCSTILCVHRAGARQSVNDTVTDKRR